MNSDIRTTDTVTTWTIVTDTAALWGVAEGDDRGGALADALACCPGFNAEAPDVSVGVYRVAADGEDPELNGKFIRRFALPESLEDALSGSTGLVRVGRAN